MAQDFYVAGVQDIDNLVRKIRTNADAKAIRRELYAGLNRGSKTVRQQMIDSIPEALPQRGGLAAQMRAKVTSRTTAKGGRYAGVSIRYSSRGYDVRTLVGKRLRHPVFGNRQNWVTQTAGVDPTVFPGEFDKQKPELLQVVTEVAAEIARKVTS